MGRGAIVLAGGRSTRMGSPKALLDWHGAPLLAHVVAVVRRGIGAGPLVVVRAPGQELPALPAGVRVVEDDEEGRGPLQGLHAGLAALAGEAEAAFASGTDTPFLHPAFVDRVLGAVGPEVDAAVPVVGGRRQPLLAAYRTSLAELVARLLSEGLLRPAFVLERCRVRWLEEDDLAGAGALRSVENVNTPEELAAARAVPLPEVEVVTYGVARLRATAPRARVRALRLGQAAAAAGVALDGHVVAAVNGAQIVADPLHPLVEGDTLSLFGADAGG